MPTAVCRLLPYDVADGPHNMAADEALLEPARAGTASLRFYGWSEATLSLGYFQRAALRTIDAPERGLRLAPLPFVRRPSGGAALVHHHEVTYALALPGGLPWQLGASWLCRMHDVIAGALAALGAAAEVCRRADEARFDGILCFQHLTAGDLLVKQAKVVGSAQRRQRGVLLQHGAILLAASPYARMLPGIRELAGCEPSGADVCAAVADELRRRTGWNLTPADWTPCELSLIDALARAKYAEPSWNLRR